MTFEIATQASCAFWLLFMSAICNASGGWYNVFLFKTAPAALGIVLGAQAYLAWAALP